MESHDFQSDDLEKSPQLYLWKATLLGTGFLATYEFPIAQLRFCSD